LTKIETPDPFTVVQGGTLKCQWKSLCEQGADMRKNKLTSNRRRFPNDESTHRWLTILLEAYHVADEGLGRLVEEAEKRLGQKLACHSGCHACCLRESYPVSRLEVAGMCWFVAEQLEGPARKDVLAQMAAFAPPAHCPMLLDRKCAVYPMRPLSCRTFVRFGEPCTEGCVPADYPLDVRASKDLARRVSLQILPHYGITRHNEKGFIRLMRT